MDTLTTAPENPGSEDVQALLAAHFALMRSMTPEDGCHVLAPLDLEAEADCVLGVRRAGTLIAIGALKRIGPAHGELKSMHTQAAARGQGIARILLDAIMDEARKMGLTRLSLETGTADGFAPARSLYQAAGFEICAPFADYEVYPLSVYMTRPL